MRKSINNEFIPLPLSLSLFLILDATQNKLWINIASSPLIGSKSNQVGNRGDGALPFAACRWPWRGGRRGRCVALPGCTRGRWPLCSCCRSRSATGRCGPRSADYPHRHSPATDYRGEINPSWQTPSRRGMRQNLSFSIRILPPHSIPIKPGRHMGTPRTHQILFIAPNRCFDWNSSLFSAPPPVFNNNQWITNRSNQSLQFWNLSRSQGSCGIIQLCSIADAENLGTVRNRSQLEIGWEYWGLWKLSSRSFPDNSNWFVVGKWNILSRLLASRLVLFCFGPPRCSRWNWSGRN